MVNIIDFPTDNERIIQQTAAMLVEGFKAHWPNAWPDMDSALKEVRLALVADRIIRLAMDDTGAPLGWIGAISQYGGHAWELHPLIVRVDRQGASIGRTLVTDLERHIRDRGGLTIYSHW